LNDVLRKERKFCSGELPYYKIPDKIVVVDSLERNLAGKITRKLPEELPMC